MKGLIVTTFIFVGVGLLSGIASAILFCLGMDVYAAIGMISTIISILLGIISMIYSYVSGKQTSSLFNRFGEKIDGLDKQITRIENQTTTLGEKIVGLDNQTTRIEKQTTKLEKQIATAEEQNRSLVEKIKMEISKENYGQENIDNIRNRKK